MTHLSLINVLLAGFVVLMVPGVAAGTTPPPEEPDCAQIKDSSGGVALYCDGLAGRTLAVVIFGRYTNVPCDQSDNNILINIASEHTNQNCTEAK